MRDNPDTFHERGMIQKALSESKINSWNSVENRYIILISKL